MTYIGVLKGSCIEWQSRPPYPDGQAVVVQLEPAGQHKPGSPHAILEAMRQPPHLTNQDWEDFDRILRESKVPMETKGFSMRMSLNDLSPRFLDLQRSDA